jgi:hypothetical protein
MGVVAWTATGAIRGRVIAGTGDPEAAVAAEIGSIYLRDDGGANTTLYVKEANDGDTTGWAAK